jgi:hypothetical protein
MTKKREKPFHLDMSFDEALRRTAQTNPVELAKKKPTKKRKATTRKAKPASPDQPGRQNE